MKQWLFNHIKNIPGWKCQRKYVVFAVDDYGNVRLDSAKAHEQLTKADISALYHFDALDSMETRADLEGLFHTLSSVQDKHGKHPVFTVYTPTCNLDFEQMEEEGFERCLLEALPQTFQKLARRYPGSYEGTWDIWREGMDKGLLHPQFHGQAHFSQQWLVARLEASDPDLIRVLKTRSLVSIPSSRNISWTAAYEKELAASNDQILESIEEGVRAFQEIFGFASQSFTPPAHRFPEELESRLPKMGIKYLHKPFRRSSQGRSIFAANNWNIMRGKKQNGLLYLVRNVVFEPTETKNAVDYALQQIEAAFYWNKPAIVSSHRVNFCGHIDPENRKKGLAALKTLLKEIVERWPEVEFITADELGRLIGE